MGLPFWVLPAMVVVILVASVILTTTVRSFGDVGDRRAVAAAQATFEGMHARGPAAAARALGLLPRAVVTAVALTLKFKPDAVLGVGGYASAAGVIAAGSLGDQATGAINTRGVKLDELVVLDR